MIQARDRAPGVVSGGVLARTVTRCSLIAVVVGNWVVAVELSAFRVGPIVAVVAVDLAAGVAAVGLEDDEERAWGWWASVATSLLTVVVLGVGHVENSTDGQIGNVVEDFPELVMVLAAALLLLRSARALYARRSGRP